MKICISSALSFFSRESKFSELIIKESGLPLKFATVRRGVHAANLIETQDDFSHTIHLEMKFTWTVKRSSGPNQMQIARRPESCRAHISQRGSPRVLCNIHMCAHNSSEPLPRRSYREPHQNRLKLICNLRHVWPARYISSDWPTDGELKTRKEEREKGGRRWVSSCYRIYSPWPVQGPENWNTYQTRKEICTNYNTRYSSAIAGNSLILITRAIMYRDYRVVRTSPNNRRRICIVRCSKHDATVNYPLSPAPPVDMIVISKFYIHPFVSRTEVKYLFWWW